SLAAVALAVPLLAAPPASADPPTAPVFEDGQAQPVFDPTDIIREEVWVRAPIDSDGDGQPDEVHAVVLRHRATELGLRSPVVYEVSPYYAGGNDIVNHDVDVPLWYPTRPYRPQRAGEPGSTTGLETVDSLEEGPNHPIGSTAYQAYFLSRGYAMVFAESI